MSLGQVALGLASIALGLNSLRSGVRRLSNIQAGPPRRNTGNPVGFGRVSPVSVPGKAFHKSGYSMVRAPNGSTVPMQMRSFNIKNLEGRISYLNRLVDAGKRDPQVYAFARRAVGKQCGNDWCTPEKDNLAEAKAIFGAIQAGRRPGSDAQTRSDLASAKRLFSQIRKNVRYTSDIAGVDTYQKPAHTLALKAGDCLPAGTKLLREDGLLVNIEDICIGDVIFDGVSWTRVTQWWDKGRQELLVLNLNNGCALSCTPGHKLFRVPRLRHTTGSATSAEEIQAGDIRPSDELLQPRELAFSKPVSLSADEAFFLGAYLSEGSIKRERVDGETACVSIAGVPNSKGIRERVIECAPRLGFKVSEQPREVYVSDSTDRLATLIEGCGRYAPRKRLPHVRWSVETAKHILQGLDADGGMSSNNANFVFSTTSPVLAVQYRVLQRLFGKSCSIKKVDEHGGFGQNAIYRVTVRQDNTRKAWAKVRGVAEGGEAHVFDIETSSHRFYLPESDVVVHNCDDYSSLTCASLQSVGIPCRFKVIRTKGAGEWNHIYPQAGFPRHAPTRWVSMDSSVNMPFGWEAPARMVDAKRVFRVG